MSLSSLLSCLWRMERAATKAWTRRRSIDVELPAQLMARWTALWILPGKLGTLWLTSDLWQCKTDWQLQPSGCWHWSAVWAPLFVLTRNLCTVADSSCRQLSYSMRFLLAAVAFASSAFLFLNMCTIFFFCTNYDRHCNMKPGHLSPISAFEKWGEHVPQNRRSTFLYIRAHCFVTSSDSLLINVSFCTFVLAGTISVLHVTVLNRRLWPNLKFLLSMGNKFFLKETRGHLMFISSNLNHVDS